MVLERFRSLFYESELDSQAAAPCDKRRYPRKTVLIKSTLFPLDVFDDVIIHNASQTGLLGEADIPLTVGQTAHISLDGREFYSGIVRWSRGRRFGLDLDDALSALGCVDGIEHGEVVGQRHRSTRIAMNVTARIAVGTAPRPATVKNVSRMGMLINVADGVAQGQRMLVKLNDRPSILGQVRWTRAGALGFKSDEPISTLKLVYSCE